MSKDLKLNIGSGFKRFDGFLNIDDDPLVEPDYIVSLDDKNIRLPFEDNSVSDIILHHILEHIGEGYLALMKEMYRVCKHGAILDIRVPHHFHEIFINDPTHVRPITVEGMRLFSKKYINNSIRTMGSSTGMAYKFDMDYEVVWYDYTYDPFYHDYMANYN